MNELFAPPIFYGLLAGAGVWIAYLGLRELRAAEEGAGRRRDFIKVSAGLALVALSVLLMAL